MYLYIGGLVAKKIELLREMAPDLGNFAVAVTRVRRVPSLIQPKLMRRAPVESP